MYAVYLQTSSRADGRREGNILLLALLIMTLLIALAAAQVTVTQKNIQASSFFLAYSDLHKYAENGISLALHDLGYEVTGNGGKIGTVNWLPENDIGADGLIGTGDEGEGDGIPTPGEPNAYTVPMGPAEMGLGLLVHVANTVYPNIFHVVSTAVSPQGSVTVDTFVRKNVPIFPRVGAVYVDPAVALDLGGNKFLIDGNDYDAHGNLTGGEALPGISTLEGETAGDNMSLLLGQLSDKVYEQVQGSGGEPSLDEATDVDLNSLIETIKKLKVNDLPPDTYDNVNVPPNLGDYFNDDFQVTHTEGDLHFAGTVTGSGILVVDGSLVVTGQFTYHGIVIVRGDIRLSGGGAEIHTFGSVMVGESLSAIDSLDTDLTVGGNADLFYSSSVLARLETMLDATYSMVYYDEK